MRCRVWGGLLMVLLAGSGAHAEERISYGRFKDLVLYRPRESNAFVLLLSGAGGWRGRVVELAQALARDGAMVAGIDYAALRTDLEADGDECVSPDGDLENLAHYLQGYAKLPTYFTPLLVGDAAGGAFAYAVLAQAPAGTFAGAITIGFCPEFELRKPLCRNGRLRYTRRHESDSVDLLPDGKLTARWFAFHTAGAACSRETVRQFVREVPGAAFDVLRDTPADAGPAAQESFRAAYRELVNRQTGLPPPPRTLDDLPLVEIPAAGDDDLFAIFLSGDGGWAGLDKEVAGALAAHGIPVVGVDSLRYFWTARTPQGLAGDLDRILRYYAAHWGKQRALLIGYSQGADVLPFAVNRLPDATRRMVAQTVLMAIGENATFEFHLDNWLGGARDGLPIRPELKRLAAEQVLCLYGKDDESPCPIVPATRVHARALPGGHHFNGDYTRLSQLILARAHRP